MRTTIAALGLLLCAFAVCSAPLLAAPDAGVHVMSSAAPLAHVDAGLDAMADVAPAAAVSTILATIGQALSGHVNGWTPLIAALLALAVWAFRHERTWLLKHWSFLQTRWGGYFSVALLSFLSFLASSVAAGSLSKASLVGWFATGGLAAVIAQIKKDLAAG